MARSLNKVQLIGNLTRDPELRYTPSGTAVCTFSVATNRSWTTEGGEKKEEVDFHRIVAWNKLAEICSQLLVKGRKVYVEGRLANRKYTKQDGNEQNITEIVIEDMIILDSKREGLANTAFTPSSKPVVSEPAAVVKDSGPLRPSDSETSEPKEEIQAHPAEETAEQIADDIPF